MAVCFGLLALALRLYFVTHAQVLQPVSDANVRGDAVEYYRYAWNMVHRGVFSSAPPGDTMVVPDSFRDPGYPLLLAIAMRWTGSFDAFYALVLVTQAVLGAATVSFLVLAGRRCLPAWGSAAAGLLIAIWPHSVAAPAYILSESLTAFLCASAILATDIASRRGTLRGWVATGVLWSFAGLTNAVLLPVAVVLAFVLGLRRRIDRRTALALALASIALPLAWGIRSTALPPAASSTTRAITNLVQGAWPSYHRDFQLSVRQDAGAIERVAAMQREMDTIRAAPLAGLAMMRDRMADAPMAHVSWYLSKPFLLWDWDVRIGQGDVYIYPTRNSPFFRTGPLWQLEAACYVANPAIMAFMLLGVVVALRRRDSGVADVALAVLVLFVTLVYSILQSEPRYSTPFRGQEMLLAMMGVAGAAGALRSFGWGRSKDDARNP